MRIRRIKLLFLWTSICLAVLNCSGRTSNTSILPNWGKAQTGGAETPRASASMQLTNEGRLLLEDGNVDDAISMLEKSVGVDPANGLNYYYLSEAWLLKGNVVQAEEFNRLAELHLKDSRAWLSPIKEQRARIDEYKDQSDH